jgi:outer membrane protein assembly factor BamB
MKTGVFSLLLALGLFLCLPLRSADWPTFGHDPQRSGWAFEETTLTPENVGQLELKWAVQVKNEPRSLTALTAPVVASEVNTPQGIKTVVYVAGSADHFFALDAENGNTLWSRIFDAHVLPKDEGMWLCPNGLNATPTIDRSAGLVYVIAADGRLYGLDLGTGQIRFGPIQFVPAFSKNWSLNLFDGIIYTSISQGCAGAQSGIYSADVREPMRPAARALLVSRRGGAGIWGRGGPVIGKNRRVYAATGDGEFDPSSGELGSSVVAASLGDLQVVDYYNPTNFRDITKFDLDLGASSPVWFADKNYELLAVGGKEGTLYFLDANSLGAKDHQSPLATFRLSNDERAFEENGIWGGLSTWRDEEGQAWVYVPVWGPLSKDAPKFSKTHGPAPHGSIAAFKAGLDDRSKQPVLEPAWISGDCNRPEPVAIANGVVFGLSTGENPKQTTGPRIVYSNQKLLTDAERSTNTSHAILYALNAKTGRMLYQSGGAMTSWVHFSGLGLANGRIYAVDHDSRIYCFGLRGK